MPEGVCQKSLLLEVRNLEYEVGENAGVLYIKAFKEDNSDTSVWADCLFCSQDGALVAPLFHESQLCS